MAKLGAGRGLRAANLPCSLLTKQFRATVGQMAARAVMQQYEIVPEQTRSLVASARACSWRNLKCLRISKTSFTLTSVSAPYT